MLHDISIIAGAIIGWELGDRALVPWIINAYKNRFHRRPEQDS